MGCLLVAHTVAWFIYKRNGWKLPRLLPFPRLEVYFAMFMLAPLATCAGRACCTSPVLAYTLLSLPRKCRHPAKISTHVPMPASIDCTQKAGKL